MRQLRSQAITTISKSVLQSTLWVPVTIGLLIFGAAVFYVEPIYSKQEPAGMMMLVLFGLTLAWILYANANQASWWPGWDNIKTHLPILVVGFVLIAFSLRGISLSLFPFPNQTSFEEPEIASTAFKTLRLGRHPLEFRFTNLLGWLGFWLSGDVSLLAVRLPFQIAGYLSLILLIICLREMQVSWPAVMVATFLGATLRLMVIAAGSADEMFSGLFFVMLITWFIIRMERSEHHAIGWAGLAGIVGGILMYEYVSFRGILLLGVFVSIRRALRTQRQIQLGDVSKSPWLIPFAFGLMLLIIATPTLLNLVHNPDSNSFLDGPRRHLAERGTLLSPEAYQTFRSYLLALGSLGTANSLTYNPLNEPVIPQPIGFLLVAGILLPLLFPHHLLERAFAVITLFTIAASCILANNYITGRLIAVMPLILITTACLLDSIYKWVERTEEKFYQTHHRRLYASAILALLYTAFIIYSSILNLQSTQRMTNNQAIRIDLTYNDFSDYTMCLHLANVAKPGQIVFFYNVDKEPHCVAEDGVSTWLYADKHLDLHQLDYLPAASELSPGALVVMGVRGRPLTNEEVSSFGKLALDTNSLGSLQTGFNVAREVPVVSFCYQCP
jgi:hypothetical protein